MVRVVSYCIYSSERFTEPPTFGEISEQAPETCQAHETQLTCPAYSPLYPTPRFPFGSFGCHLASATSLETIGK